MMPRVTAFQDFLSLALGCLVWNFAFDRKAFVIGLLLGVLLGGGFWLLCGLSTRLWNRHYHLRASHHALCACAAVSAAFLAVLFAGVRDVDQVAKLSVKAWRLQLELESAAGSRELLLQRAREGLRALGLEDSALAFSPAGVNTSLAGSPSLQAIVQVYATEAARSFEYHRPFLSRILWARREIPSEWAAQSVRRLRSVDSATTVSASAFDLAADWIQADLEKQVPRVVTFTRVLLIFLFVLIELIPFGLAGYGAYKDLRTVT